MEFYSEKEVDLGHSLLTKRADGIIEIQCADNFTYEKKHIMENHACLKKMANGRKMLVLSFAKPYTLVSAEARKYVSKGHHKDFIAAEAFVIQSLAQRIIGNFYLKASRPIVPANIFLYSDIEEAEKWLRRHIIPSVS